MTSIALPYIYIYIYRTKQILYDEIIKYRHGKCIDPVICRITLIFV